MKVQSTEVGAPREGVPAQAYLRLAADWTTRRLRPLARRRFSTARPFLVAMRLRKPWSLSFLRLEGWKVRFICSALVFRRENGNPTRYPAAL